MKHPAIAVHPSFTILKEQEETLTFSLFGEVKMLRGSLPTIIAILHSVDGSKSNDELLQTLSPVHPRDKAERLLKNMFASGILVRKETEAPKSLLPVSTGGTAVSTRNSLRVGCLGTGKLAQAVTSISKLPVIPLSDFSDSSVPVKSKDSVAAWTAFFENYLASYSLQSLVVLPENMNYVQLCALNRACLTLQIPWILAYFNGCEIALGPSTIPYKTPCLECLLEHRLQAIAPSLNITWDTFLQCIENFPIPEDQALESTIQWAGWLLSAELERLATFADAPLYTRRQLQIPLQAAIDIPDIQFEAVTTCPACLGMNKQHTTQPVRMEPACPERVKISLQHNTVRHGHNGLRSKSTADARALLDRALSLLKANVKITQSRKGVLDDIIPSFRSYTSAVFSPDLPFTVDEHCHWGKGMNEAQAYLSAGFELMERISAEYNGNVEMIQLPYKQVKDFALDLQVRVGEQHYLRNIDSIDADIPVDWVWGWSLVNQKYVLVPASMVYLSRTLFQGKFMLNSSSGLAAGTTIEDAILQGLLEAAEHDARYIWQANPVVTPKLTDLPESVRNLTKQMEELGFTLFVRDCTTDLGIYVFKAWLVQKDNPIHYAAAGLGASLNPDIALSRAISEAKQSWPSDRQQAPKHYASKSNTDLFSYNTATLFMHYQDNMTDILAEGAETAYASLPNLSSGSISQDILEIQHRMQQHVPDSDLIVVNLTREEFGIPVVRVITSGLQNPSQPLQNFPQNRLFEQATKLGYRDKTLSFKELFNDCHQQ